MDEKKDVCAVGDELQAGPVLPDGSRPCIRHTKDHEIQIGFLSPLEEGQPIPDGAVHLEAIEGTNRYRVEEIPTGRPAKVNSRAYRDNWEGIFGKQAVGEA